MCVAILQSRHDQIAQFTRSAKSEIAHILCRTFALSAADTPTIALFSPIRTDSYKMTSAKTPVLVGISQIQQSQDDLALCQEPLALMIEAVEAAAEDAEAPKLLEKLDQVCVNQGMWNYSDPARSVAAAIGAHRAKSARTNWGGNFVQFALNQMALAVARGELNAVAFTGAEWGRSLTRFARAGKEPRLTDAPGQPSFIYGERMYQSHLIERDLGCVLPVQTYPMFENALRHARGERIDDHMMRISNLWARFAQVAAKNPHACIREAPTAEEIRTPPLQIDRSPFPIPSY